MRRQTFIALGALLALVLGGGVIAAQSMPKLVDGIALVRSADSPGQVLFNHATHVDADKPACATCHPKDFSILGQKGGKRVPVTHKAFEEGRQCGRCHDGTHAFALDEDCTNCHQSE